jgi:hypothetical protein
MTSDPPVEYTITALDPSLVDAVRDGGPDASGRPAVAVIADGGEPLRCCLRDARPGERCLLFGYEPVLPEPSPYREIGAVYAHADRCPGWSGGSAYPPEWRERHQVLRAYDRAGWIHPSTTVHDGRDPEAAIARILGDPDVVEVHSRNIAYGCYMFAVRPA